MADQTTNYGLTKPTSNEYYNVTVQNDNMDKIDETLKDHEVSIGEKLDKTGDASNTTNIFAQAGTRENLASGEKNSASLSKIMKWFSDLKSIVFSGSTNDVNDPNAHMNIGSSANATQSTINTKMDTAIGGKEPTITTGTSSQYWKGNKTWSDFATDVRATLLTGLSTVTNAAITATDTILSALGKLQAQIYTKETSANKGIANGYASLDSNAKVPLSQINDALLGNVSYQGVWNASTNTPTLPSTPASKGIYYIVSVAGTLFGKSFEIGDWIISNGTSWDKVDNTDAVSSVAGRTGNVVLNTGDITDPNAHTNIGSSANETQSTINTKTDAAIGNKLDKTGDASNTTNVFSQAGTRVNLSTGEKISVSLGKLMKWFTDFKAIVFSGSTNDLTDPNAHGGIGSIANDTQSNINTKINDLLTTQSVPITQAEATLSSTSINCYKKGGWAYVGGQIYCPSALNKVIFTGLPPAASIYPNMKCPIYLYNNSSTIVGWVYVDGSGNLTAILGAATFGQFTFSYPIT
jgi:hypothetical protein